MWPARGIKQRRASGEVVGPEKCEAAAVQNSVSLDQAAGLQVSDEGNEPASASGSYQPDQRRILPGSAVARCARCSGDVTRLSGRGAAKRSGG